MTIQTLPELAKHPFVEDEFQPQHIEKLKALAQEVRFTPDQIIFQEGEEFSDFYLIVSGRVALEMFAGGRALRVQTLTAGDELGWSAMLKGSHKYFQARALGPVEALQFHGGELLQACKDDASFGYALMHRLLGVVAERLHATRLQVADSYSPVAKKAGA
jgi:CRP/FNR family transcriptional regulator, cyclic AMP receptor protein